MAEVGLGIAASIIAVIHLTGKLTSLSYGYIGGVKRAGDDMKELLEELSSLMKALITLKDFTDANPLSPTLQGLDGPIRACTRELETLEAKLTTRKGVMGMIDRLQWPFKNSEFSDLKSRIERHKSLFTFALAIDQM